MAHKKRADVFYKRLKEDAESALTFSYDCRKNLVLPKFPDQAAYYLGQMYLYNFAVCQGNSYSSQTPENMFAYAWLETDFTKSSNQIASTVHQNLSQQAYFEGITNICLFADGHCFIPLDRVFGNLEREFRKIDVIEKPELYMNIMKKHATVIRLGGEHCPCEIFKTYADGQIKEPGNWHFKFQKAQKISSPKPRTRICA
ncbi:hypothetical protein PR048_008224 [Dryococelus australis]|uniref:Uncharacterized protein n=1 Tax=Dryococelus australis TaxID=614101 RepID=A0ABQ9HWI4_9NEOP|nr:hypothetical protein PR048_008224 [Dryococelus australis]